MRADLLRLTNQETAMEEVLKIFRLEKLESELRRAWIYSAPQLEGKALTVVIVDNEYFFEKAYEGLNGYEIDDAEGLFEKDRPGKLITKPSMRRIEDAEMKVFDSKGFEVKPFAGNSSIDFGYVSDFNRDGVLERAEGWHSRSLKDFEVQVFSVATIEKVPRRLLEVIYNRHPEKDSEDYGWDYRCFDDSGDGLVEVGFGPRGSKLNEVIFEWSVTKQHYVQRGGGEHPHLRVLQKGEVVAEVAKEFRYPLPRIEPERVVKGGPYRFVSLKGAGHEKFREFFNGKEASDDWGLGNWKDDRFPDHFWDKTPKEAALAMVEANRSDKNRREYRLVIDDRDGIEPPESGWICYRFGSSGFQSFQSGIRALRFGGDHPALFMVEWAALGKSDRYQNFYEPSSRVRKIEISGRAARHLAEVFFWLDRIRSRRFDGRNVDWESGSSHDGFGILSVYPSQAQPWEVASGTIWHSGSIQGHFESNYNRDVMLNLVDFIWSAGLRRVIDEKCEEWPKNFDRAEHREELIENIREIFAEGEHVPLPIELIERLVSVIGDAGLTELEPEIEELEKSIPAEPTKEELQLKSLRGGALGDPFKTDEDLKLSIKLEDLLRFDRGWTLRDDLRRVHGKFALLASPEDLKKAAAGEGEYRGWASNTLLKNSHRTLSDAIKGRFQAAKEFEKNRLFQDLVLLAPSLAEELVEEMSGFDRDLLICEIADFRAEYFPVKAREALPKLMAIIRNRDFRAGMRMRALGAASKMKLLKEEQDELRELLKREPMDQGLQDRWMPELILEAFGRLETREGDLEYLWEQAAFWQLDPKKGSAILESVVEEGAGRKAVVTKYFKTLLKAGTEDAGEIAWLALAMDLRELAPLIEAAATEHSRISNGKSWESVKGQKFHLPRYVAALWREQDKKTQARMWIDFMAGQFWRLDEDSREVSALKKKTAEAVRVFTDEERMLWIDEALAHHSFKNDGEVEAWLHSLR